VPEGSRKPRTMIALPFHYLRVLTLWRWGHRSREIAERVELDTGAVANIARRLRKRGFDLPRHDHERRSRPGIKPQYRHCLNCERRFWSPGIHVRMCDGCKGLKDDLPHCRVCGSRFRAMAGARLCPRCEATATG